jgi:methionine sulfoxide reductase heme-binding subunit
VTLASAPVAWYVARAGGMVAFVLLTIGVLLGLGLSGRARSERWPRFAVEDVHRFVGLLAGTFVAFHVLGLLANEYLPFSLRDVIVPGLAAYRPLVTALGVVAMELLAALALTNRYRKRLPYRFWRRAHYLNFAVWCLALVHGIGAGTDSRTAWGLLLYASSAGAVLGVALWRTLRPLVEPWAVRLWLGTGAFLGSELIFVLGLGPLRHGGRG